jgi:zinc protease
MARLGLALAVGLLWAVGLAAAAGPWPHAGSDLKPDPALVFGRLENGLRYVLMANATPADRVSLHLNVQAGSLHETEDQKGLAHFIEHMLFNGSTHFPPGELVRYFQRIGMAYGADVNAHTGFDETVYHVLLPDGRAETLDEGLLVLWDYARGALLEPAEIDRERQVVLAEMRTRDSPAYRSFKAGLEFEFQGLRVARRLPIGDREVIEAADRPLLKAFYDAWYRPERMVVVAVGDFDPEAMEALIRSRFGDLAARADAPDDPLPGRLAHQGLKVFYHPEPELGHVQVEIQQVRQVPEQLDTLARKRRELAETMAARIIDHRLEAILSRPDPPYTHAGAGSGIFLKTLHYGVVSARTSEGQWSRALTQIETTLRQALEQGFHASEVDRVGRELLAELDRAAEQAPTRQSPQLARQIIRHLNAGRVMMAPSAERDLLAPVIRAMTPDELQQALRRVWSADHWLVKVVGSLELDGAPEAAEQAVARVVQVSRATPTAAPFAPAAVRFPYLPPPAEPGREVARATHADLGIVQVLFDNGVRLNLKATDFKAGQVLVSIDFGPGRSAEPAEAPGLAEVAERLLNTGGLGALTREELERALAGANLQVSLSVAEDRLRWRGETVRGQLALLLDLLRHRLLDPGWRQADHDLVLARLAQQYADWRHSVDGRMMLEGRRFLAGGDTRFGLPPLERLQALDLETVRAWAAPILGQAPLEISVVGDLEVEASIDLVGRFFGTLPRRQAPKCSERPGPRFPHGQRLDLQVDTRLDKALAVVAFATEDQWDIRRTRRLNLLAQVFEDRLREQVREKLGASYSPAVHSWASRAYPGHGLISAFVQVSPDQVETVVAVVSGIAADLAGRGIDADAWMRSREPTLTGIKDLLQSNAYWLNTVLAGAWRHPRQLDWSRTILADHGDIRPEELSALAARYLVPQRSAQVRIVPGKSP